MAKETKPKNIRATEETHDKFAQLAEENFPNQGAALEAFINAWEIQNAKNAVPERETDIADFDSHIQALQRAFLHSLDVAQSAENRARDEFRRKLETMEEEKEELRRKLELAKDGEQYYKGQIEAANKTAIEAATAADTAKRHATTLETSIEETKQNAAAQIADKQRLIDTLTEQLTEALEKASAAEEAIKEADSLRGALEKSRREHEREQKDAQAAAQVAAAKAEAEKALAISEARNSATTELLKTINENSALKVEIERLKARITLLESPKEMQAQAANATPMSDQQTPPTPAKDTSNASKRRKTPAKKANSAPNAMKDPNE
jgi:chromosome segregation ATPase